MSLAAPAAPPRDRFLAFAFAGADLLVEAGKDGKITFAAGAFRQRMGMEPEQAVGRHLRTLVAPPDRVGLTLALEALAARGRIPPMVVRLNDPARTPATFAALLVPSDTPRICVTLGPVPTATEQAADTEPEANSFAREAEARLRDGGGGEVALVEVRNWQQVKDRLSGEDQKALRTGIAETLGARGEDGLAREIADGCFGVLVQDQEEVSNILTRLDALLRGSPAGRVARVEGLGLSLDTGELSPSQAARALRYALSQFRSGGVEAARTVGGKDGLGAVLTRAEWRARMLRPAIAGRKFQLKYQPVVSLVNRETHHYEALLRPAAALLGQGQTTQDFVVFVEAVGLTEELDLAVAQTAIAALRAQPEASVAVNVSGLSLQSDTFREHMLGLLSDNATCGPDVARRLLVELTETVEVDDMATAAASIEAFRLHGVPVCLDDFGAGAAAFRYLREFQIDFVKIDGQYVRRAPQGARERSFLTSMVDLAAGVGARVIAEQVETEEEAALMRLLGVEFGQGWLFGKPGLLPGSTAPNAAKV